MPVSGLVITLADATDDTTMSRLRCIDGLDVGAPSGRRLAASLDTTDEAADRAVRARIDALPGVQHVDIVFVAFDDAVTGRSAGE